MVRAKYASEIEEIPQESIWPGFLPEKALTVLAGESGTGKSTFARWLVRILTRGECLPDGQKLAAPIGVVWISNEETDSTVVGQLRKAGADLTKVLMLSTIEPDVKQLGVASRRKWKADKEGDLKALRRCIWENPNDNVGLVIIDAARGMSDKSISYPKPCREVLEMLDRLADEAGVAILILHHVNRRKSDRAIERLAGSGEMYNFPRCVLMLSKDTDDEEKTILSVPKPFLQAAPPSITYKQSTDGSLEFIKGFALDKLVEYEEADAKHLDSAILAYLSSNPGQKSVRSVCAAVRRNYDAVAKQLQRLAASGRVDKPAHGMYCAKLSSAKVVAKSGQNVQTATTPQAAP